MASSPDKTPEPTSRPGQDDLAGWVGQYGPALRRYFSRRAAPADLDDLVQEVFLRMQARAEVEPVSNVEAYLFAIAKSVLLMRYRHERLDGLWRSDPLDETIEAADELSPERILVGKQQYARLAVAILNLPPRTRAAFQMHRFERLSYSVIAERMGISKGAVQVLIQRAVERLVEEMREGS